MHRQHVQFSPSLMMTDSDVVFEFRQSRLETIRATLGIFEGRDVVDLRVWLPRSSDGVLVPGKKGLTIDRTLLPELEAAVHALRVADSIKTERASGEHARSA